MDSRPLLQADFLFHDYRNIAANRDKAEAANLNQRKDDQLAEQAPVLICVGHYQSRYAGCGGRGKKGVQKRHAFPAFGRKGQAQKKGTYQDNERKTKGQHSGVRHFGFLFCKHKFPLTNSKAPVPTGRLIFFGIPRQRGIRYFPAA